MISKEEVKHIAKLARIDLTDKEAEKFQKELSLILGYIEKLNEVDVEGIKPASYAILRENITRQDETIKNIGEENEKLSKLFPETKNGYLKVKSILKNGIGISEN